MYLYVAETVFLEVARSRSYTSESVQGCIVERRGDHLIVDNEHPAYPRSPHAPAGPAQPQPAPAPGPGTELKALLKKVGITASPGCSCNKRATIMDEMEAKEPGWCEKNIETICDWLQEEATKRKLPFLRTAGKILIRKAISNAKKKT